MNLIDSIVIAIVALAAVRGLLRGLIKEAATLTTFVLGSWLAYRLYEKAALLLDGLIPLPAARIIMFAALLIGVGLIAHLVGNLLTGLVNLALLGWVNRLGGLLLGGVEGAVILGMLMYAISAIPFTFPLKQQLQEHPHARMLVTLGASVLDHAKTLKQPATERQP